MAVENFQKIFTSQGSDGERPVHTGTGEGTEIRERKRGERMKTSPGAVQDAAHGTEKKEHTQVRCSHDIEDL